MNVLFVSNDPKIFDPGSAVRARLAAYAAALGEAHVVSAGPAGAREASEGPLHLHPVSGSGIFRLKALAWKAFSVIRREGIEVVSAQDPFEYGFVAWKASLWSRARLHLQLHTDPFAPAFARESLQNRVRLILLRFLVRRADRIRVVSARLAREIERRYRPKAPVSVMPIYADLNRFRSIRRAPERGLLLWIGRFEREKDPLLALDAFATARAAGNALRLVMLGAGNLERPLRERAQAFGVESEVDLPGWQDPAPYLARAELVLATSRYEGYGLSIVEALAAGAPVLSTDVGVAREAGALIAGREEYADALVRTLAGSVPPPAPVPDPYVSFDAYVTQYADDIRATVTREPARPLEKA